MNFKKKILITGGAGYIGSHTIIEFLANTDFDVLSVDNYSNSSEKTFERIEKITGKSVKNYTIDLCDKDALEKVFIENKDIVAVVHFAAFKSVPESVANPLKYYHNNIASLVNILSCLKTFNVPHFIFSSSCSVYGNINQMPVKESTALETAESPYGYTKQIGEKMIIDFANVNPTINAIALRYFNPVGAHSSGWIGESPLNAPNNLVPVITGTAIGKIKELTVFGGDYPTRDGTCIRDYVHVSDIANAHLLAVKFLLQKKNDANYMVFNLGTGKGISVLEAIYSFEKVSGVKLRYRIGERRDGDVVEVFSDTEKVSALLEWKPVYDLDEMMESAWKWELNLKQRASDE